MENNLNYSNCTHSKNDDTCAHLYYHSSDRLAILGIEPLKLEELDHKEVELTFSQLVRRSLRYSFATMAALAIPSYAYMLPHLI